MLTTQQQKGLTLIEMMIGLLVGAIITGGAISVFSNSVKSSSDNIKITRLNQDLRSMMDMIVRDIRRAGFVTSDLATPDPADLVPPFDPINLPSVLNNPFFDDATAGATTDIAVYNGGSCIVYAYNRDDDADNGGVNHEIPSAVDSNERLGFRLNNGELDMRKTGATNENCTVGLEWESITEPDVEITALSFTLTSTPLNVTSMINDDDGDGAVELTDTDGIPYGDDNNNGSCDSGEVCTTCTRDGSPDPACLYIRTVTITLSGRLADDNSVTQTLSDEVRIRNDKYLAAAP